MHQFGRAAIINAVCTVVAQQVGLRVNLGDGALHTVDSIAPRVGCTIGAYFHGCIVNLRGLEGDALGGLHAILNHHALYIASVAGLRCVVHHVGVEILGCSNGEVATCIDRGAANAICNVVADGRLLLVAHKPVDGSSHMVEALTVSTLCYSCQSKE